MKKSIFYTFGLALAAIAFASCDDFLDKMPDSRAELDTEERSSRCWCRPTSAGQYL